MDHRLNSLNLSGIRFAVYARKSNEQARHQDHRSTTRQVEHATAWVRAHGGEVLPDHVFVDDKNRGARK